MQIRGLIGQIDFQKAAIFLIWLFHVSGILGIIYGDFQWFVSATPINLLLSFALLLFALRATPKVYWVVFASFLVGMVAEGLGVNYGWIFGHYEYGDSLGLKIAGVPWLIGVNWAILVVCTAAIASDFFDHLLAKAILGVGLMLLLDAVIEPMAPVLDFWVFEGGTAPVQNYIGWALVAFPLHLLFHGLRLKISTQYTHHLFLLQVLFFTVLLLQINTLKDAL